MSSVSSLDAARTTRFLLLMPFRYNFVCLPLLVVVVRPRLNPICLDCVNGVVNPCVKTTAWIVNMIAMSLQCLILAMLRSQPVCSECDIGSDLDEMTI